MFCRHRGGRWGGCSRGDRSRGSCREHRSCGGRQGGSRAGRLGRSRNRTAGNAIGCTRVGEGLPGDGDEFPIIAGSMQRQLKHPEGFIVADLGVRLAADESVEASSPCAYHELPNAFGICLTFRILRGKTLVVMVMTVQDHVCAMRIKGLPERPHTRGIPMLAGVETRLMPYRQRTGNRIGVQICPATIVPEENLRRRRSHYSEQ